MKCSQEGLALIKKFNPLTLSYALCNALSNAHSQQCSAILSAMLSNTQLCSAILSIAHSAMIKVL